MLCPEGKALRGLSVWQWRHEEEKGHWGREGVEERREGKAEIGKVLDTAVSRNLTNLKTIYETGRRYDRRIYYG